MENTVNKGKSALITYKETELLLWNAFKTAG
jgi:hypothetical protein